MYAPSSPFSSSRSSSASSTTDEGTGARGRPRGSKDRAARKRRAEPLDLARCKLDLLKIMLYTRDLADGWRVDDSSRFLFAHTRGFREWNRSRKVDSLALQMRMWLQRDIVPVVEATRLFEVALPATFPPLRRATANAFLVQIAAWVHGGGQLDCLLTPMYQVHHRSYEYDYH
jgi:hypothetical protein